jgi:hypothetical protein
MSAEYEYQMQAYDGLINCNFKGAYKALDSIDNDLSYFMFIDTLPSAYLATEFSQCIRLESKLEALESQVEKMPAGPRKDQLLARIESNLEYVEFKKERVIELEIQAQDEDYEDNLVRIRNYYKKSRAEFEKFIKEQKTFDSHLKNEAYWDKLLEILGEYGSCYEHMYADVISDQELFELIFVNRKDVFSPEFEADFLKTLEQTNGFDAAYIQQQMAKLRENPVQVNLMHDKNALMTEGVEQHILVYQFDGKEVRFNLRRDRAANGLSITQIDDPLIIKNKDYEFLSLYAHQHLDLSYAKVLEASPSSLTGLIKENFKESSEAFSLETN